MGRATTGRWALDSNQFLNFRCRALVRAADAKRAPGPEAEEDMTQAAPARPWDQVTQLASLQGMDILDYMLLPMSAQMAAVTLGAVTLEELIATYEHFLQKILVRPTRRGALH